MPTFLITYTATFASGGDNTATVRLADDRPPSVAAQHAAIRAACPRLLREPSTLTVTLVAQEDMDIARALHLLRTCRPLLTHLTAFGYAAPIPPTLVPMLNDFACVALFLTRIDEHLLARDCHAADMGLHHWRLLEAARHHWRLAHEPGMRSASCKPCG